MTKIGWIHLSDLHRGMSEQRQLWPNVEEQLFADLERMHRESGPWQILFFTGDLVQTGSPREFRLVEATLLRLYEHLSSLGSDPVFVSVPGNHDLKRPQNSPDLTRLLHAYSSDRQFREQFWKDPNSPGRIIVKKAFSAYRTSSRALRFPRPIELKMGALPGDFSGVAEVDSLRVGIIGLNTAFLQLIAGDLEGKLAIDVEQIIAVCGDNYVDWFQSNTCNFFLTHHPPSWLTAESHAILDRDIYIPGRILAHFCGHLHEGVQASLSLGGATPRQIIQSAALFGLDYFGELDEKKERRHGYSSGQLDIGTKTAALTIWPRSAVRHQAGYWHFVPDNSASLDAAGATKPLQVPINQRKLQGKRKRRTFSVLLVSTDHDLAGARTAIADHISKSLGIDVAIDPTSPQFDLSILIQAWWWDDGRKVDLWKRTKAKQKLIFVIDENADWPPRRLIELESDAEIKELRSEFEGTAKPFSRPSELPEVVAKAVTDLMQSRFGEQIGLAEWERTYLEFRLPAWRSGRTAQGRPHLFDTEQAEQLYQPELYVEMDGISSGWSADDQGYPQKKERKKGKRQSAFEKTPRVMLSRWLGVEDLPRIALIGAPGGGKTIFLTRMAAIIAGACLGRPSPSDQAVKLEKLRRDFGLPIPVVLEATKMAAGGGDIDTRALVTGIADELSSGGLKRPDIAELDQGLQSGRYLLLIDALDEIADAHTRIRVLTMLKGIAGVYPEVRLLVTTRSARYTGDLRFGPELQTVEVAPLGSQQVETLCGRWTVQKKQDSEYRSSLIGAARGLSGIVSTGPDDQGLTENPLMLTAICMVFERYRSLPDDRGRLCELLVDDLCRSRRSEDASKGWKLDEIGKKDLLQRIAHSMQEEGAQSWPIEKAINVARQLVPATETTPNLLATKYVDWAADHTGILRFQEAKGDSEQVRFWHRLFREHLAATRIAQLDSMAGDKVEDLWQRGRLCDPFWEDVVRLLPRALGTIEKANSVRQALEELAARDDSHRGRLLGLVMAGIIENRDLFPDVVFLAMARRMAQLYETEGLNWPLKDRVMFLEGLGRLDPAEGDPRSPSESWISIPLAASANQASASIHPANPRSGWSEATDLRSWIAKYPVTVQEFSAFLQSPDFRDPTLWEQMPPAVLKERESIKGRLRPQFARPNSPVVNVGVGEAIAYCRWKTSQRADGMSIRLPISTEWVSLERAAGKAGRLPQPSKNEAGEFHANTYEAGLFRPTPIGAFPTPSSGISDALGNVWEWCLFTHAGRKDSPWRTGTFGVYGASYNVPVGRSQRPDLFAKPPGEFEFCGEPSIGFRCVLAKIPINIPSVLFSRAKPPRAALEGGHPPA